MALQSRIHVCLNEVVQKISIPGSRNSSGCVSCMFSQAEDLRLPQKLSFWTATTGEVGSSRTALLNFQSQTLPEFLLLLFFRYFSTAIQESIRYLGL